jgi:hypothetical protein
MATNPKPITETNGAEPLPNPFADLSRLKVTIDPETVGVKKVLTTCKVGRPSKQHFFRVHPSPAFELPDCAIVKLDVEREHYLIDPAVLDFLPGEYRPHMIVTYVTRTGTVGLWPLAMPGPDGKTNDWHKSALEGARVAREKWIRLVPDQDGGCYIIWQAENKNLPEPVWPDLTFNDLMALAFKDYYVASPDHPLIEKLHGLT